MICPIITQDITMNHSSFSLLATEWQHVFLIASCIHFVGVIFYGIFASGELQDWAKGEPVEETVEMDEEMDKPPNGYGANPNVDTTNMMETQMTSEQVGKTSQTPHSPDSISFKARFIAP